MTRAEIKLQLQTLAELLQQEREMIQTLNMEELQKVVQAKEALLEGMQLQPEEVAGMEDLLRQIDQDNRRNAFLLWTGMNWVRDLMGFFGKTQMPQVYGGGGQSRALTQGGRLLSGKV